MANAIFKTKVTTKANMYDDLKNILTAAGWENISSNKTYTSLASDADVFYSPSKSGDLRLLINLRDYGTATAIQRFSTTTGQYIGYRMLNEYTPSDIDGENGDRNGRTDNWYQLALSGAVFPLDTEITLTYYCDLNRLIFVYSLPEGFTYRNLLVYLGMPDEEDLFVHPAESREVGIFVSWQSHSTLKVGIMPDHAIDYFTANTAVSVYTAMMVPPFGPTLDERIIMSPVLTYISPYNYRGVLTDLYMINPAETVTGDILQVQVDEDTVYKYKIFVLDTFGNTAFNATGCALRIE